MSPAEEGDQQLLDDLVLADDDATQLLLEALERLAKLADGVHVIGGKALVAGKLDSLDFLFAHA